MLCWCPNMGTVLHNRRSVIVAVIVDGLPFVGGDSDTKGRWCLAVVAGWLEYGSAEEARLRDKGVGMIVVGVADTAPHCWEVGRQA